MLKAKGVLPLYRSCFPIISVDKQTLPYIPIKVDRASTSQNSLISKNEGDANTIVLQNSTVTSLGDPRGVYL